jgi:hypothetical protein
MAPFGKWGRERSWKPFGTRLPAMICCPTQATIWETLIFEPAREGRKRRRRGQYSCEKADEGNAGRRTLRTASSHDQRRVVATQFLHTDLSNLITNLRQVSRDLTLERLFGVRTGEALEFPFGGLTDVVVGFAVGDRNEVVLFGAELDAGRDVGDTDGETLVGCWRECGGR